MKKLLSVVTIVTLLFSFALAQQPTAELAQKSENADKVDEGWTKGGTGAITFNQIGLKNWSAGGDPSISFLFALAYYADLKKGKHLWQNRANGQYGLQKVKGESFRKNTDILEFSSKYGYQIAEKWYFATLLSFRSQFSKTYEFDGDGNKIEPEISKFASPAIVEYSIGFDFVPNEIFNLYLSPVAARFIIVADDDIAAMNLYGNDFKNVNTAVGALAVANYKQEVFKNVTIGSTLKLYKDYLNGPAQNIDVDWQTNIGLKVNDYISASLFIHLIYDYDVDTQADNATFDRNVQFKNVLGVGFAYNFGDKK